MLLTNCRSVATQAKIKSVGRLVIDVLDCNDNAPRFLETVYRGHVAENLPKGALVLSNMSSPLVLRAEDTDSPTLHYDIIETLPRKLFYVESTTGKGCKDI